MSDFTHSAATTPTGSTLVPDGLESIEETGVAQQDDPPASHKRFGKVCWWLGSIPRRLRQV